MNVTTLKQKDRLGFLLIMCGNLSDSKIEEICNLESGEYKYATRIYNE